MRGWALRTVSMGQVLGVLGWGEGEAPSRDFLLFEGGVGTLTLKPGVEENAGVGAVGGGGGAGQIKVSKGSFSRG